MQNRSFDRPTAIRTVLHVSLVRFFSQPSRPRFLLLVLYVERLLQMFRITENYCFRLRHLILA